MHSSVASENRSIAVYYLVACQLVRAELHEYSDAKVELK